MALSLRQAVDLVAGGGVVVYPTETLWGLGGAALDRRVHARVMSAKGILRPRPVPVLAASIEVVRETVPPVPGLEELAGEFWPGSLTLVLPSADPLLHHLVGPGGGLGVRVSAHPVAQALAIAGGGLLLSTSANRTGQTPPSELAAVAPELLAASDGAVEWSGVSAGAPSTLLIYEDGWRLARAGAIPAAALRSILAEAGEELTEEGP